MSSDAQKVDYLNRVYTHLESSAYINQALLKDVEELFNTHGKENMKAIHDGLTALSNITDMALKDTLRYAGESG